MIYCKNYNATLSLHDISDDSGPVVEPVTLAELKNYMRLEGFQDPSAILPQTPLSKTLAQGATTVQDNLLIGAVILSLARSGTVYTQAGSAGNLTFAFDSTTGIVTFLNPGNVGGETIAISYGPQNTSGVFNFTGDDGLLNDMIMASRQLIEEIAGISIVAHTWEAVINYTNQNVKFELPKGPNITIWSFKDRDGNAIASTSYFLDGNLWKWLSSNCLYGVYTIVYEAGYLFVPKAIKIDVMRLATYMYENRGDDPKINGFAMQLASKYSRNIIF